MKTQVALGIVMVSSGLFLSSCASERAIWIETNENGGKGTKLAMTEGIARELLETKSEKVNLSASDKHGLITREMLQAVLDGREHQITIDDEDGSKATIYAKQLTTPSHSGKDRLVLEIHKEGKQVFRIALPDVDIEQADEKSDEYVKVNLGWKSLLPFLAKTGGAVYVEDEKDETEVWVYVE